MQNHLDFDLQTQKVYAYSCCCFHAAKGLALYDSISIDDFKSAKKQAKQSHRMTIIDIDTYLVK
jgi:hypothetical protein